MYKNNNKDTVTLKVNGLMFTLQSGEVKDLPFNTNPHLVLVDDEPVEGVNSTGMHFDGTDDYLPSPIVWTKSKLKELNAEEQYGMLSDLGIDFKSLNTEVKRINAILKALK